MRRLFLTTLLVAGAAWLGSNPLNACGDKFLLIGRGSALGAYAAVHPATILIVRHGKAGSSAVIDDPQLATSLQRAGHKVRMLDSPAKLTQTLSATRFDVVLADLSDAVARRQEQPQSGWCKPRNDLVLRTEQRRDRRTVG